MDSKIQRAPTTMNSKIVYVKGKSINESQLILQNKPS